MNYFILKDLLWVKTKKGRKMLPFYAVSLSGFLGWGFRFFHFFRAGFAGCTPADFTAAGSLIAFSHDASPFPGICFVSATNNYPSR